MKLRLIHAGTCPADYWSGHHLPHVQIPVIPGMSGKDIREAIKDELRMGAVMGSDYHAYLLGDNPLLPEQEKDAEKAYRAAVAAVNRARPARKHQRRFFTDIEISEDGDAQIYAYFVFVEI